MVEITIPALALTVQNRFSNSGNSRASKICTYLHHRSVYLSSGLKEVWGANGDHSGKPFLVILQRSTDHGVTTFIALLL